MREIKFRAWDKVTGTMYTDLNFPDNYLIDLNMDVWDTKKKGPFGLGEVVYNRFELIQFTGLKDKNDKEIYEGDIMLYLGSIGKVVYRNDMAMFMVSFNVPRSVYSFDSMDEEIEVIGNIYQNPELLKD